MWFCSFLCNWTWLKSQNRTKLLCWIYNSALVRTLALMMIDFQSEHLGGIRSGNRLWILFPLSIWTRLDTHWQDQAKPQLWRMTLLHRKEDTGHRTQETADLFCNWCSSLDLWRSWRTSWILKRGLFSLKPAALGFWFCWTFWNSWIFNSLSSQPNRF